MANIEHDSTEASVDGTFLPSPCGKVWADFRINIVMTKPQTMKKSGLLDFFPLQYFSH